MAMNNIPAQEIITQLRNQYSEGSRVKLISMDDPYTNLGHVANQLIAICSCRFFSVLDNMVSTNLQHDPNLKPGDRGFVTKVDDIGTVHIQWDNGSTLGAAYGADQIITTPYITDTLFEEIMSVRSAGQCNMLDTTAVQRYAYDHDCYNLVIFLETDRKTYANFILRGEREING